MVEGEVRIEISASGASAQQMRKGRVVPITFDEAMEIMSAHCKLRKGTLVIGSAEPKERTIR